MKRCTIGVLDIYGFEIFESNGFEQFIINFCNEKLQQIFIELTLKQEQEEYIREGIAWTHIDFFNNAVICDLIEGKNGIMALLDDCCLRPSAVDDAAFLGAMNGHKTVTAHDHYESRTQAKFLSDRTLTHGHFRLRHYAGHVTYLVDGFIEKNRDTLFPDISRFMYNCSHSLAKEFFSEGRGDASYRRPISLSTQFKSSVGALMKNLLSKNPNYIRCVKPNDEKRDRKFDLDLVRHQVLTRLPAHHLPCA